MKLSNPSLFRRTLVLSLAMFFALLTNAQTPQCAAQNTDSKPAKGTLITEGKVFEVLEKMPQFPGGEQTLMRYISQNLKYPLDAQEKGIQGTSIIRFVVTNTGKIGRTEIIRSASPILDNEALRVVQSLPDFIPGEQKGEKVSVWYTLPIRFKLDGAPAVTSALLVKEQQVIVLDGKRLPVGFDLRTLDRAKLNPELLKPDTEAKKAELVAKYGPDASNGVVVLTTKSFEQATNPANLTKKKDTIYDVADKMPQFPGGEQALMNFISNNLKYPLQALEKGVQGVVQVRFVVDKSGKVTQPAVLNGVDRFLNTEAVRVVKALPDFEPAVLKGEKVSVWFTLPIRFRLD